MRDEAGLDWLHANDPYAQSLTRADYRQHFGILSIGGERQPVRPPIEKVDGKLVLEPCRPYLVASGRDGRPQVWA